MDKKLIITWNPKREESNGGYITRVDASKKGAKHYQGTLATGVSYDYWAFPVKSVNGTLVWIDKLQTNFGFKFVIVLKGEDGRLNRIETSFDTGTIKDVCNLLLSLHNSTGKTWDWLQKPLSFVYWVFKKTDNGKPVLKNGVQQYKSNIAIEGLKGFYNKENPLPDKYKWVQQMNGSGKMEWNSLEEMKHWELFILTIQKALLSRELAIPILPPFYTSLLCGAVTNPTGIEQDSDTVQRAQFVWESVKGNYRFTFQKEQQGNSSDDFSLDDDAGLEIDVVVVPEVVNEVMDTNKIQNVYGGHVANTPVINIDNLDKEPFDLPF